MASFGFAPATVGSLQAKTDQLALHRSVPINSGTTGLAAVGDTGSDGWGVGAILVVAVLGFAAVMLWGEQ